MASRPPAPSEDEARRRWMVIQAMRFMAIGFVVLGILLTRGVIDLAGESNETLGYVFIAIGLIDGLFMPTILARKWRTPEK